MSITRAKKGFVESSFIGNEHKMTNFTEKLSSRDTISLQCNHDLSVKDEKLPLSTNEIVSLVLNLVLFEKSCWHTCFGATLCYEAKTRIAF